MLHVSSFDIRTAQCFLNKMVIPQYEDFLKDNASSRHALLTSILVFHMFEWANPRKNLLWITLGRHTPITLNSLSTLRY